MPQLQEGYNFKIEDGYGLPEKWFKDMLAGKLDHSRVLSVMRYILQNLNVSLTFVPLKQVKAMMANYSRDQNIKINVNRRGECVIFGLCDSVFQPHKLHLCKNYHCTPPFDVSMFKIMTSVNDGIVAGKRFSLGGIEASIWMTLIFSLLLLSVVCWLFKMGFVRSAIGNHFTACLEYVWFYATYLLMNTAEYFPRRLSTKLMLSGWLLGTFVLIKAYSGILKSEMTVSDLVRVNTLEDIKKYPGMRPAILNKDNAFRHYIRRSRTFSPTMDQLAKEAIIIPKWNFDLIDSYPNGTLKYGILLNEATFKYVIIQKNEELLNHLKATGRSVYLGKRPFYTSYIVLIFNDELPKRILEKVDYLTYRYVETGQSHKHHMIVDFKIRPVLAKDSAIELSTGIAVTVKELSIMFYIWLSGITIGLIIQFLEILRHQFGICLLKKSSQCDIRFQD